VSRIPVLAPLLRLARRLYDWMLAFADKPAASRALFGISFAESSFFPLPPDPLLMAMGAGSPKRAVWFAFLTSSASVLGAVLGYVIGMFLMDSVGTWLLDVYDPDRHTWEKIEAWYDEYGMMALLLAAITPIPFKVFFGEPIVAWLDKWFDLAAILFTVLLVGGFVAIKYL
jgi:membrane protein YqaA with SNARE-associated domain